MAPRKTFNNMRWGKTKQYKRKPDIGDRRIVTRFLWFPKDMAGVWRWWEKATWEQTYVRRTMSDWVYIGWWDEYWTGWLDRP